MKKFFIALSVLAALFLTVVPSQALVGMPDRVPANQLLSFFVVAMDQSLDTLIIVQEVGGVGNDRGKTVPYGLHWMMFDPSSNHVADRTIPYTKTDVVAISCKDIIFNTLVASERTALEADLNSDGTKESYIGYVTWSDTNAGSEINTANHFVGKMYIVNLSGGIGSGVSIAGREALLGSGWDTRQHEYTSVTAMTTSSLEGFSPVAYWVSALRERSATATSGHVPDLFRLLPRWYLYTDAGENNIFIWKSFNAPGATSLGVNWSFSVNIYDNEENPTSKQISLPKELNFIDIREVVPPDWYPTDGIIAGWIDIRFPSTSGAPGNPYYWQYMDFLCYSWQRSANASASLNWSALFESHRDVSTTSSTF